MGLFSYCHESFRCCKVCCDMIYFLEQHRRFWFGLKLEGGSPVRLQLPETDTGNVYVLHGED